MTPTARSPYPVFASYRGCVLYDSPHRTPDMDAGEGPRGHVSHGSMSSAYRRSGGRNLEPSALRRRRLLRLASSVAAGEDGVSWQRLADELMDAAALDEKICERPLRRLMRRLVVLEGALVVLAAGGPE